MGRFGVVDREKLSMGRRDGHQRRQSRGRAHSDCPTYGYREAVSIATSDSLSLAVYLRNFLIECPQICDELRVQFTHYSMRSRFARRTFDPRRCASPSQQIRTLRVVPGPGAAGSDCPGRPSRLALLVSYNQHLDSIPPVHVGSSVMMATGPLSFALANSEPLPFGGVGDPPPPESLPTTKTVITTVTAITASTAIPPKIHLPLPPRRRGGPAEGPTAATPPDWPPAAVHCGATAG